MVGQITQPRCLDKKKGGRKTALFTKTIGAHMEYALEDIRIQDIEGPVNGSH